jgi:hypothetical protein
MARLAADLQGIFAIRWQGFVAPVENAEDAVLGAKVVPLADLGASLGTSSARIRRIEVTIPLYSMPNRFIFSYKPSSSLSRA